MSRLRSAGGLALWGAFLALTLRFLHQISSPATSVVDGSAYVFTAVRYAAIGVGWYLAATTLLSVGAHALRSTRAIRLTERVAAAPVNRLTRAALGAACAVATLAPATAAAQAPEPVPVMTWKEEVSEPQPDSPPPPPPPRPELPAGGESGAVGVVEVVVAPGDHLWSLASSRLADDLGREPTDSEITPFWLEVIRANRSRLRDPALPDLIYPGDRIVVPPPGTFPK